MLNPFARIHRRALSVGTAFALVPVSLAGALTLAARPSLALQDAKTETKDAKTYTIARSFTAKEVNHYKIDGNVKANVAALGGDITIITTLRLKEAVKKIADDGTVTLQSEFEAASAKLNDMEQDLTDKMPTVTTTVDKTGHVLTTKLEGGDPQGAQVLNSLNQTEVYPTTPVKVGDTWKIEAPKSKPGGKNTSKTTGTATLVGLETIDGVQTLRIKIASDSDSTMDNPFNPGETLNVKAHTMGVSNIELTSGKVIRSVTTTESEGGALGKATAEMTFALVKDDGKTKPEKKSDKKAAE